MSYKAVITHEDGAWLADVPQLDGAHTFARTLPKLYAGIREVIILADDLDDDADPEVDYTFDTDDPVLMNALSAAHLRLTLRTLETEVAYKTAEAVYSLQVAGYSVRDAAALLGITAGRVSQLVGSHG